MLRASRRIEKSSSGVQEVLDTSNAGLSCRRAGRRISWYVCSSSDCTSGVPRDDCPISEAVTDKPL